MQKVTGFQLIRLLEKNGWVAKGVSTHGVYLEKQISEEGQRRATVVPRTRAALPQAVLAAILGKKQTGLGFEDLDRLIERWEL